MKDQKRWEELYHQFFFQNDLNKPFGDKLSDMICIYIYEAYNLKNMAESVFIVDYCEATVKKFIDALIHSNQFEEKLLSGFDDDKMYQEGMEQLKERKRIMDEYVLPGEFTASTWKECFFINDHYIQAKWTGNEAVYAETEHNCKLMLMYSRKGAGKKRYIYEKFLKDYQKPFYYFGESSSLAAISRQLMIDKNVPVFDSEFVLVEHSSTQGKYEIDSFFEALTTYVKAQRSIQGFDHQFTVILLFAEKSYNEINEYDKYHFFDSITILKPEDDCLLFGESCAESDLNNKVYQYLKEYMYQKALYSPTISSEFFLDYITGYGENYELGDMFDQLIVEYGFCRAEEEEQNANDITQLFEKCKNEKYRLSLEMYYYSLLYKKGDIGFEQLKDKLNEISNKTDELYVYCYLNACINEMEKNINSMNHSMIDDILDFPYQNENLAELAMYLLNIYLLVNESTYNETKQLILDLINQFSANEYAIHLRQTIQFIEQTNSESQLNDTK